MQEITLKKFVETTKFENGLKIVDLMLTETDVVPDGWVLIGKGGHTGEYGDYGSVSCWASADHRIIVFNNYGMSAGYDAEEWSEITVHVAS